MVAPAVQGIDLSNTAGRSRSGRTTSFKTGNPGHVRQPSCRIMGHTSEAVRETLAALENVSHEPFPQLTRHQWSGAIHTLLAHSSLDPTNYGRVVMEYVMKQLTTTLE